MSRGTVAKVQNVGVALTGSNIVIDKNDVIAIAVSRSETHIQTELSKAMKEVKRLETAINECNKLVDQKVKDLGTKTAKPVLTKLETLRTQLDGSFVIQSSYNNNDSESILVVIRGHNKDQQHYAMTFCTIKAEFDDSIKDLKKRVEDDTAALATAKDVAVDWRRKLAQLPTLERQCRAKLATAALSRTEEGLALLEQMSGSFEADVLALPL